MSAPGSGSLGLPAPLPTAADSLPRTSDLLVVGAGAFGAWTAFFAQAGGAGPAGRIGGGRQVTLLDAWGTGNSRSTSGDETRIIRSAHGDDRLYTRWARRSRELWLSYGEAWQVPLLLPTGTLWFTTAEDAFEQASAATLAAEKVPYERLEPDELLARWPQLGRGGELAWALFEPEGGSLMARRGCQAVTQAFQRAGGRYALAGVRPGRAAGGRLQEVVDEAGRGWSAESFVFACGPWLPWVFPEQLRNLVRVTKQDAIFIGPREGDRRFHAEALPSWIDYGRSYYGLPATDDRGFKLAPDRYGPVFDPSNGERIVDPESVRVVRRYLRDRFPDLSGQPVVETRVCQYESTPDAHFLIDRLPGYDNVWIAGGGSGHGYKHGPRLGEYLVARLDGAAEGDQDGPEESRFRIGPREPRPSSRSSADEIVRTWDLF